MHKDSWLNSLDERIVYDYSDNFKKSLFEEAKNIYSEKCQKSEHLSAEFKKHVSNPENIFVKLTYESLLEIHYRWITPRVKWDHDLSYSTNSYASGTASVTTNGSVKLSDVQVHKEYRTITTTSERDIQLFSSSSERNKYIALIGPARFHEAGKNHLIEITDKTKMPIELREQTEKEFPELDTLVQQRYPENLESNVKTYIQETFDGTPKNVKILEIRDYYIDTMSLYFLPHMIEIKTEFKGKTYSQKQLIFSLKQITSIGEESQHYLLYENEISKRASNRFHTTIPTILCCIIAAIPCIFMILNFLTITGLDVGIDRSGLASFFLGIASIITSIILFSVPFALFPEFSRELSPYISTLSTKQLKEKIKKDFKKSILWRYVGVVITAIVSILLSYLYWYL